MVDFGNWAQRDAAAAALNSVLLRSLHLGIGGVVVQTMRENQPLGESLPVAVTCYYLLLPLPLLLGSQNLSNAVSVVSPQKIGEPRHLA